MSEAFNPARYAAALSRGIESFNLGNVNDAIAALTEAASCAGREVSAHINLAKLLSMQGRGGEAGDWLRLGRDADPDSADALFDLGQAFLEIGLYADAARSFSKALEKQPAHRLAGLQLVAVLLNLGQLEHASAEIARLTLLFPNDVMIARARLKVSRGLSDLDGKLAAAREILRHVADDTDAVCEIARNSPNNAERASACAKLQILCRRNPGDIEGWKSLAAGLWDLDGYERAAEVLEEGISLTDDLALRLYRALFLPKVMASNAEIDFARGSMERHLDILIGRAGELTLNLQKVSDRVPFYLAYHGRNDRGLMEKLAKAHLAVAPDLAWVSPHLARPRSVRNRIRIGFLSAFFSYHSVGKMVHRMIKDLDRSRFEIFIYRLVPAADDLARSIDAAADAVIVYPRALAAARTKIAEADLDILFYADVGMEPFSYYLAFARLARRQVVWPGHPVTTGLDSIDAYISSGTAEPERAQDHYTEPLVRFSAVPIYEDGRPIKPKFDFRERHRLPRGPLYVCPMAEQKFHPDFDVLLRGIFDRDPHANFAFVGRGDLRTRRLQERMLAAVPKLHGRLFVLPWLDLPNYANLFLAADAVVDTPHFSGSGTSRDAATLGVATVTLEGAFMRGRLTAGMYRDMGLPHLALNGADDYLDLAVRLANDADERQRLGSEVQAAVPSLVRRKQVLAEFENLFESLMKVA